MCSTHRSSRQSCLSIGAALCVIVLSPRVANAQVDILTNRYDAARTGASLRETTLTTANVNVERFGKLFAYPVDGAVYAQPLYVSGVTVSGSSTTATAAEHVSSRTSRARPRTRRRTASRTRCPSRSSWG